MTIEYSLLSLLAIYGMITLFMNFFKFIGRKRFSVETANIVLLVNNQEQNIEGIVREALESRFVRNVAINGSFVIIDMNSKDDTLKILRRLETQFPLIEVCSFEEKESIFYK